MRVTAVFRSGECHDGDHGTCRWAECDCACHGAGVKGMMDVYNAARQLYGGENCRFDGPERAEVTKAKGGHWVSAWVWVPNSPKKGHGPLVRADQHLDERLARPYARVFLYDKEAGGYTAKILEFPGCISEGDTIQEALENLENAAAGWIDAAIAQGLPIPEPFEQE